MRITRQYRTGLYRTGSVGPTLDANGIRISFITKTVVGNSRQESTFLRGVDSKYPITFMPPTADMVNTNLRNDPYPPLWGSSTIQSVQNGKSVTCGTGPVVFSGSGTSRTYGILTAAHCGNAQWYGRPSTVSFGSYIGRTHASSTTGNPYDTLDVQELTGGSSYGHAVWRGSWNSNVALNVREAVNPVENESICNSGSLSGQLCGTATSVNTTDPLGNGPGFYMDNSPSCAARSGDSGSVIFSGHYDETVTVRGFEEAAGGSLAPCPGNPAFLTPDRSFGTMFAIDITQALNSSAFGGGLAVATVSNSPAGS